MVRLPDSQLYGLQAQFCQALANPARIHIVAILADGPKTPSDLATELETGEPNVSRHLRVLHESGLVISAREGPHVLYALADKRIVKVLDLMREMLHDQLGRRTKLAGEM